MARPAIQEFLLPQAMTPHFPIYMDYGATTPCDPRVVDAMIPWLREHCNTTSDKEVKDFCKAVVVF